MVALGLFLCGAAVAHAEQGLPVPVFVTFLETPRPPPMKPAEHTAAFNRTRSEMFDLARTLRQEHGEKTNAWPRDMPQRCVSPALEPSRRDARLN